MFSKPISSENLPGLHKKPKKRFLVFFCLISVVLGIVLIGLLYFIFYSDYLKVRQIETHGNKTIAADYFFAKIHSLVAAENGFLNVLGPDNILFWKFSKKPLLSSIILPAVSSLTVSTDVLKGKVDFDLRERNSIGIWCGQGGDCYNFDESAVVFGKAPSAQGALILKIEDESGIPIVLGRRILPEKDWFQNILRTAETVRDAGFGIASITVKDLGLREWEILTSSGFRAVFSFNFLPEDLGRVLATLKERLAGSKLSLLDFRVPHRVYYK